MFWRMPVRLLSGEEIGAARRADDEEKRCGKQDAKFVEGEGTAQVTARSSGSAVSSACVIIRVDSAGFGVG